MFPFTTRNSSPEPFFSALGYFHRSKSCLKTKIFGVVCRQVSLPMLCATIKPIFSSKTLKIANSRASFQIPFWPALSGQNSCANITTRNEAISFWIFQLLFILGSWITIAIWKKLASYCQWNNMCRILVFKKCSRENKTIQPYSSWYYGWNGW